MAFNHAEWNRRFLAAVAEEIYPLNDARGYGVQITRAEANLAWRIIGVHHLTGDENRSNHNAFFDVLGGNNAQRVYGSKIASKWEGQQPHEVSSPVTIDKPENEAGGNYSMNRGQRLSFWIEGDQIASDVVSGLSIDHPDEDQYNTLGHHSFYIVWQLISGDITPPDPPVDPPIEPGLNWLPAAADVAKPGDGYTYFRVPTEDIPAREERTSANV